VSGPTDKDPADTGPADTGPADQDLPDEQQLEAYLKGGSSVSQQYRQLRSAEVPAELDRLVLRQAQEAVKTTRPAKSRVWMRWTAPLAVAASAVLVVSIVIQSGVQHEVRLEMPASAPAPAAAPATMEAERKRETVDEDTSASAAVETQRAPAPALEGLPAEIAERSHVPPADVYISPVEPTPPQFAPPPELRFETPAAPAPAAPLPQTASNSRRQGVEADKAAKALSAEASGEADATREVEEVAVTGHQILRGKQPRAAGPRGTVPTTRPTAAVADSTSTRQVAGQLQQSDPELWLHEIRKLRLQDKQEEADREWRRFRELFPDHPVAENDTAREVQR